MKKLSFLFVVLCSGMLVAQEINWITMDEALAAQEDNPKKIMVDVYTSWCGPCKLLDRNTFTNKDLIQFVNDNYYAVKFDGEGTEQINYKGAPYANPNYDPAKKGRRNSQHHFASAMRIRGYPSIVFFDEVGDLIQPVVGYKTAQQLEIFLKMIENDDYKNLTTQEAWVAYQENFEGTFQE